MCCHYPLMSPLSSNCHRRGHPDQIPQFLLARLSSPYRYALTAHNNSISKGDVLSKNHPHRFWEAKVEILPPHERFGDINTNPYMHDLSPFHLPIVQVHLLHHTQNCTNHTQYCTNHPYNALVTCHKREVMNLHPKGSHFHTDVFDLLCFIKVFH